jgi:hypothetical protein
MNDISAWHDPVTGKDANEARSREGMIPSPQSADSAGVNPLLSQPFNDEEHAKPTWDEVFKDGQDGERLIAHITGTPTRKGEKVDRNAFSLVQVVEAFHAATLRKPKGMTVQQLVAMISHFPEGAYGHRAGTEPFLKDVRDEWQRCNETTIKTAAYRQKLGETLLDPWADPSPPKWPTGILARPFENTIAEIAVADGVDMGAQAMAFLAAASGAADKQSRLDVYLNGRFMVPPILWVMILAESGMRKSPILQTAFAPIKRATGHRWRDYQREKKRYDELRLEDQRDARRPEEPGSLFVDDITPEKLAELLGSEPRGTLMLKEELVALFDFGRYSSSVGARGFLVTTHDGSETWFHRKSTGATHLPNAAMTIFGCTQPARLAKFKDLEDDGLLQRFLIARPARTAGGSNPSVHIRGLSALEDAVVGLLHRGAVRYRLSPAGTAMVRETERLGEEWERQAEAGLGFPAWARKMHGQHARLALTLHLMEAPSEEVVAADVVERAGRLILEYLLPNAYGFYCAPSDSGQTLLRSTAGWLLTKAPTRFTAAHVQRGVAGCSGKSLKFIQCALDPLVTGGWLEPETEYPSNRAWTLVEGVREVFAERARAERERRAALAALVMGRRRNAQR